MEKKGVVSEQKIVPVSRARLTVRKKRGRGRGKVDDGEQQHWISPIMLGHIRATPGWMVYLGPKW